MYVRVCDSLANKDMGNVLSKWAKGTTCAKESGGEAAETNSTKERSM
jgi:hypothetical protein